MRLVHSSDWHLGRTLHGVELLSHQAAYLDHLVELVRDADAEAVLVSGDVYDRAIPPVEAVQLLADALARLSELAAVVLTPGNHDSAVRLGFAAGLMRPGVHLRARTADVGSPVLLDGPTPVAVYPLPYLDPDVAREALAADGEPLARSHEAVLGAAMARVRADLATRPGVRSVVMAHAFVVGGATSESERDIRVGGVDSVPAGVFEGVDYVALGHLHGAQRLTGPAGTVLQYCGSPLAYSFSEARQRKVTAVVDLDAAGDASVDLVAAPVPRRLVELVGPLDQLLAEAPAHREDWARVVATDARRPAELYPRVRTAFPNALVVEHRPGVLAAPAVPQVGAGRDPLDVVREFVEHVTGSAPDDAEAAVLQAAYEHVRREEQVSA